MKCYHQSWLHYPPKQHGFENEVLLSKQASLPLQNTTPLREWSVMINRFHYPTKDNTASIIKCNDKKTDFVYPPKDNTVSRMHSSHQKRGKKSSIITLYIKKARKNTASTPAKRCSEEGLRRPEFTTRHSLGSVMALRQHSWHKSVCRNGAFALSSATARFARSAPEVCLGFVRACVRAFTLT